MSPLGHTAASERPERSRNAKAQARHRAKRKAYIDQLEQTVTKLQTQLGVSVDQIEVLPPPMLKIRELEQENGRLLKENDDLRRMLQDQTGGRTLPLDLTRRTISHESRNGDREYKRRRPDIDEVYMDNTPSMNDLRPPPPLTIPHSNGSHYGQVTSHTHSGSMYNMNGATPFHLPNTPSGSSSTSSPPFSPATMHSAHTHTPSSARQPHSHHHVNGSHYPPVKVEDDSYSQSNHYTTSLPSYTYSNQSQADHGLDTWHSYSSERALHR